MTRVWWVALLAIAGCKRDAEYSDIQLVLGLGGEAPQGFRCVEPDAGPPLMRADRACPPGEGCHFALMIDLVDMGPADGEAPSCRALEFHAWCRDPARGCKTLDDRRVCRDVHFDPSDAIDQCTRVLEGIHSIEEPLLTDNTPDRLLYTRAVAMEGFCADYGYDPTGVTPPTRVLTAQALYQPEVLLGCAESCPVVLDNLQGSLTLDLEVGEDGCTLGLVHSCAVGDIPPPRPRSCGD